METKPNRKFDAVVIGSGPNGLAAAIKLAQAGLSVAIFERKETLGGGMRSGELTLLGFVHDVCSAIHPLGIGSPYFRTLNLEKHGLEWIEPPYPLAHPFDDGTAALLERSIESTGKTLGNDALAYKKIMEPFVKNWEGLAEDVLAPLRVPQHPLLMLRFGFNGILSARRFCRLFFSEERAKSLFMGLAAHANMDLGTPLTAAFGLVLGFLGHAVGWPLPRYGSQTIGDALGDLFKSLGGQIFLGEEIHSIDSLPASRVILCDTSPRELIKIAGHRMPDSFRRRLEDYRYGPGVFKMDWALSRPIPWKAQECLRAGTVHLGGTSGEIEASESEVAQGKHPAKPYIILAQQSLFDPTRAPEGKQTAWGYCHVPNGSSVDMTEQIEAQIERFAPGFKDCILARATKNARQMEQYNSNYVGGDINGGMQDIFQLYTRPTARLVPYSTPVDGLYICSASTPPGGGVHGMCGYHAALAVLKKHF